ncbi:MAG: acyltransferase [Prevotellaceae bacterium]|nr:acyltransferase [Candidatus Faecinaster equi]
MRILTKIRRAVYLYRRQRWISAIRNCAQSCGEGLKVNRPSSVNGNTILGDNVNFNGLITGGDGSISIGNNFHSGTECMIITNTHDYDHGNKIPYGDVDIEKEVIIEDNVWIGNRVIILGGAHLHEGCIVQAGSVVVGDIPYCAICGGILQRCLSIEILSIMKS